MPKDSKNLVNHVGTPSRLSHRIEDHRSDDDDDDDDTCICQCG